MVVVEDHGLLGREVSEEGALGDVGVVGDLGNRRRVEPLVHETLPGSIDDRGSGPLFLSLPSRDRSNRLCHARSRIPFAAYQRRYTTSLPRGDGGTTHRGGRHTLPGVTVWLTSSIDTTSPIIYKSGVLRPPHQSGSRAEKSGATTFPHRHRARPADEGVPYVWGTFTGRRTPPSRPPSDGRARGHPPRAWRTVGGR